MNNEILRPAELPPISFQVVGDFRIDLLPGGVIILTLTGPAPISTRGMPPLNQTQVIIKRDPPVSGSRAMEMMK
jgi:hypothetical protein